MDVLALLLGLIVWGYGWAYVIDKTQDRIFGWYISFMGFAADLSGGGGIG
ncbi:MAG: hypothetical protein KAR06_11055 [Deltaproteobacteria bacterium]|nr:hypothetical protein [Deltaproteobacteria bacterium]